MPIKNGDLTINGKEYKCPAILSSYIQLCIYSSVLGGIIGTAVGFTAGVAAPIAIGGVGLRILGRTLHNLKK